MTPLPPGVRRLFQPPRRDERRIRADVDEEIAFHLDMRTEELMSAGMDRESARRRAEEEFGDVEAWRRTLRGADARIERRGRRRAWLDGVLQDLAFAGRTLRKRPGFTAAAAGTLALGVGATTLVFTVVNGVLLRPLPYPESERIVNVWQTNTAWLDAENPTLRAFARRFPASYPVYQDWRSMSRAFESVGAFADEEMTTTGGERPERLRTMKATAGLFDVLGVEPALGRTVAAEEDRIGGPALAVLSHGLWRRRFDGDADAVGRTLVLDGRPHTVVGVMPEGFHFPTPEHELWITLSDDDRRRGRSSQFLGAVARLAPGVDLAAAREDLAAVTRRIAEATPDVQGDLGARIAPRLDEVVGDSRRSLLLLLASAALVLIVACVNVTNLLLVRATTRGRELAVRAALGAGRGRIARALLSESVVLAVLGGGLGALLAVALVDPVVGLLPDSLPRTREIDVDGHVLAFAAAVTLGSALVAGAAAAFAAGRTSVVASLRGSGRGLADGRGANRARSALVVAELALALLLLVGAGLLGRSLARLVAVDPGFDAAGVVISELMPPEEAYPDDAAVLALYDRLRERLAAVPGVERVAFAEHVPFFGGSSSGTVNLEDAPPDRAQINVGQVVVDHGYFDALRIPVREGRGIGVDDREGTLPVAVINGAMAERYWPDGDPIGQRLRDDEGWRTIVGVVGDVRRGNLAARAEPRLYLPMAQTGGTDERTVVLTLRTAGDADDVMRPLRSAIWDVAPDVPVPQVARLADRVDRSVADPRFRALLIGSLALLAAVLAVAGVYALVAFSVARRTGELGLRIAIGAAPARVTREVVARGLRLGAAALAIGLPIALGASRLLRGFLFEVGPRDPSVFALAAVIVLATALLAAYLPARRAGRVDPRAALETD